MQPQMSLKFTNVEQTRKKYLEEKIYNNNNNNNNRYINLQKEKTFILPNGINQLSTPIHSLSPKCMITP
jgi:hypothetical protein